MGRKTTEMMQKRRILSSKQRRPKRQRLRGTSVF